MTMVFWDYPKLAMDFMNREHETFIDLMNDMEEALTLGKFTAQHFRRLVQHCQEHFAHEEREMKLAGFPPYPVHKAEHDRVLELMLQLLHDYEEQDLIGPLLDFIQDTLPDWFAAHIASMDRVTADYLARHKASAA